MARVRITCWRDVPLLVTARDGADEVTAPLSVRFQELADAVAMQAGLSESDEYLAQWRVEDGGERLGSAAAVAAAVAAELEAAFGEIRTRTLRT